MPRRKGSTPRKKAKVVKRSVAVRRARDNKLSNLIDRYDGRSKRYKRYRKRKLKIFDNNI